MSEFNDGEAVPSYWTDADFVNRIGAAILNDTGWGYTGPSEEGRSIVVAGPGRRRYQLSIRNVEDDEVATWSCRHRKTTEGPCKDGCHDEDDNGGMYPSPEDFECVWTDEFDDMYPEFAPEPISVKCSDEATHLVVGWENNVGDFGLPFSLAYCAKHASMWVESEEAPAPFGPPAIRYVVVPKDTNMMLTEGPRPIGNDIPAPVEKIEKRA